MTAQLPPRVWAGRGVFGWILMVAGVIVGAVLALAAGIVLVVLAVVVWLVWLAIWLVGYVWAWIWFAGQRMRRVEYPFVVPPPVSRRNRSDVFSSSYLSGAPRLVGAAARLAGFLLGPLALVATVAGTIAPRWRARPYFAVFTLRGILAKAVGLGRRRGWLIDGHDPAVQTLDDFLVVAFPQIADFVRWWRDPDAPVDYVPSPGLHDATADQLGLQLGAYPDPLGFPGLAAGAMRRRQITGYRDLLVSQREIDDMCDPDLDDRNEVGVVRISSRVTADGIRHWLVQFPSTKSWHPRAGVAPNDLTADLVIGAEREPTMTRAAIAAMSFAGIAAGEPVMLAGFSLGGMVAAQVATRAARHGFNVTHLVTAGAPLGRVVVPDGIRVLALEHVLDIVPRIRGAGEPGRWWRGRRRDSGVAHREGGSAAAGRVPAGSPAPVDGVRRYGWSGRGGPAGAAGRRSARRAECVLRTGPAPRRLCGAARRRVCGAVVRAVLSAQHGRGRDHAGEPAHDPPAPARRDRGRHL
ncbi:hypothetical protein ACPPVQ_03440 [Diaminobutyricibacter sp. McL0618]|uniref:hypothetical protein n=1 Tax=Leifsonia sp. McL0618 TaxID=3415677 RepID=UPI003CE9F100